MREKFRNKIKAYSYDGLPDYDVTVTFWK